MDDQLEAEVKPSLSREQKTGFVLLLIFAVMGLSLGVLQIRNTLLGPFALNNSIPPTIKYQVNDVEALRFRDTDNDGLSDYDELYNYGTSPYLLDSFSYGVSDKEVVSKGFVRCANAGKNCVDESTSLVATSTIPSVDILGEAPPSLDQIMSDPDEIRYLLVQTGMKKEILDKLSDQDLMNLVLQLISTSTIATTTQ